MTHRVLWQAGALSLLALSACATIPAPTISAPIVELGDQWIYRYERRTKSGLTDSSALNLVSAVQDRTFETTVTYLTAPRPSDVGKTLVQRVDRNTLTIQQPNLVDGQPIALAFPLVPGKHWSFTFRRTEGTAIVSHAVDASVVGVEDVTVPAGSFRATRVLLEGNAQAEAIGYRWRIEYWYAPDAKNYARIEMVETGLDGTPRRSVVTTLQEYRVR